MHVAFQFSTPSTRRLLALRNGLNKSVHKAFDWKAAMNPFAIFYTDRITLAKN
jgi:hypothetical protein